MRSEIKQRIEQIKRGEVPQGYKKTKIGIVPEEWETKKIGDILKQRKTLMCVSEDTPLLSFTIEEGVIEPSEKKTNKRDFLIKDISTKKFALTEVGDIIYNPANIKFGAIHRNSLRRGVVSPIYGIFYGEQNSVFMGYLLHSPLFIDYVKVLTEGTVEKLKTLKADTFVKLQITLPTLAEQKKIAEILACQDKLIELNKRKVEELKRLKKAYLSKMFPKKGCDVPELRFKGFTSPWEQRKFKNIFDFMQNNTLSRADLSDEQGSAMNVHYGDILVKFGEILDVNTELLPYIVDDAIVKKYSSSELQNGDVIIADAAEDETVGKCTEIVGIQGEKVLAGLHTIPIRAKKLFSCGYLGYYMNSNSYHKQLLPLMQGTKVSSISKSAIQDTLILYSKSIEEQRKITDYFRNLDNIITLHQRKVEELQNEKNALMQLLLTGIVRAE